MSKVNVLAAFLVFSPFYFAAPGLSANPGHLDRLRDTNQCPSCDLAGADLEEMNLFGANLVNANLRGANLNGANLGSANLTDADLTGASLRNAYLYRATLDGTNLGQADLSNSYLREVELIDINLTQAKLQGVNLKGTNLVGLDFQGADLSGANLSRTILSGIGTSSPDVGLAVSMSGGYFPAFFTYSFCNESNPDALGSIDNEELEVFGIAFANFEGANLTGANLSHAVAIAANLKNANLSGANLSNGCFTYADFNNATLDGANLKDARLYAAVLENVSLSEIQNADLSEAYRTVREAQLSPARSEARANMGAMNRAQQAYHLEEEQFATDLEELGIGLRPETEFYRYEIIPQADPTQSVMMVARAKVEGLPSFTGAVFIVDSEESQAGFSFAQLCVTEEPSPEPPAMPRLGENSEILCPIGSVGLN